MFQPGPLLFIMGYVTAGAIYTLVIIPCFTMTLTKPIYDIFFSTVSGPGSEFWDLPQNLEESGAFLQRFMMDVRVTFLNVYLVLAFPFFSRGVSLIVWLVLINTYTFRILYYRGPEARFINAFDCTMLGLVCYVYGLRWRKVIGMYLCRYWFLVLFVSAVLWPVGLVNRLDEHPPEDPLLRARYNLLEAIYVVLFLTAVERMLDYKIITEDKMDFLNWWSLILFLVHKAVLMTVPPPSSWVVLLGLAVPCYVFCRR
jgi:hypothetical protein